MCWEMIGRIHKHGRNYNFLLNLFGLEILLLVICKDIEEVKKLSE